MSAMYAVYHGPDGLRDLTITETSLSGSSVVPTSGATSTPFTFHTTYTDSTGLEPTSVKAYVDGAASGPPSVEPESTATTLASGR